VTVGREHPPDAGRPAHLEQQLVLVGGVQEDGLPGRLVPHDEHVVLERADDELVDADVGVLEVGRSGHASRVPTDRGAFGPVGGGPVPSPSPSDQEAKGEHQ
jgi:hypothetical protein